MNSFFTKLYYFKSYFSFASCGKNLQLSSGGKFVRPSEITFHDNVFINSGFYISARNLIFGNNIMIGPRLLIECDNHIYDKVGNIMFEIRNQRNGSYVTIQDDVWIGGNVSILTNVVIGEGCVVGAGSVVNKNLPPYTICVGVPCKPIKTRFSIADLEIHLLKVGSKMDINYVKIEWEKHGFKKVGYKDSFKKNII